MKIVIDLTAFNPEYGGGVGTYTKGLIPELLSTKNFNDIHIICVEKNAKWIEKNFDSASSIIVVKSKHKILSKLIFGFSFHFFPISKLLKFGQSLKWKEAIDRIDGFFDITYVPTTYINFPLKKSKIVVSLHDCQEMRYPHFFSHRQLRYRKINISNTLKEANVIQTSSKFIESEIRTFFPKYTENLNFEKIPEGVDLKQFSYRHFDSKESVVRILFPASFHPHKNHRLLFDSMKLINTNIEFEISITGLENDNYHEVQKIALDLKLNNLKFLGYLSREELILKYQKSDIVISCSLYESSSLPILEGVACGCLVLASDIQSHQEMSTDFNILLFQSDNAISLSEHLLELLELVHFGHQKSIQRENLRAIMSRSWTKIAHNYWDLFSGVFQQDQTVRNEIS